SVHRNILCPLGRGCCTGNLSLSSLLHHLDLKKVFSEVSRILKAGGSLVFREPVGTNPLFQLYRAAAPTARTVDERPFTFSDLRLMRSYFDLKETKWFRISNILSAFFRFGPVRSILTRFDPILGYTPSKCFYWQFAGIAKKK
ncbi:MAG: SAM-dependent methyltransferase, partial [Paracoccaceae bacterium]